MANMPVNAINFGNGTFACLETEGIASANIWKHGNPFKVPYTLFMLQVSLISVVTLLLDSLLKPIGQPIIIPQLLGGLLIGPSLLGHTKKFADSLFPIEGLNNLKTAAILGFTFVLFLGGVKMSPALMLRPGKKAMAIGFSVFIFATTIPSGFAFIFVKFLPVETSIADTLIGVAALQSIVGCPVVASLLTELKIINTDIGRLALSSALFSDLFGLVFGTITFSIGLIKEHKYLASLGAISSIFVVALGIVFIIRPIILWMFKHAPEGNPCGERYIFSIFVFVLFTAFVSESLGQHYFFGPIVLGFVVPEGSPLAAALETKLDSIISKLFYPLFIALCGLETNIFKIHIQSLWIVGIVFAFAWIVKILSVMVPAMYSNTPTQEAFVLALILSVKGHMDVLFYSTFKESKMVTEEGFALSVLSILVVTGILHPMIRLLYDPSSQYLTMNRCTIQHSKRDSEFRILACIQNQDNIPTFINLLEISHATEESPVAVIGMILVELVGRTNPLLVSTDGITETNTPTAQIVNALRLYEDHNQGNATVQSFTSISYIDTMHDDICHMARDKSATIILLPFHKQWAIDGLVGSTNRAIQTLNTNVLHMAPCSVGIFVDRGILSGSLCVLTNQSLFQVAAVFIGGQDDIESLCYACRMAKHECVRLVVIRFLRFGSENSEDRKRDSDLINEYRRANAGNNRFEYAEEVVRDGAGLAASLRGLVDCFDLIIVGRQQQDTQILAGLDAWSECPELGTIGDMLASPDFESTASVLVVQQQRIRGKLMHRNVKPTIIDRESVIHDVSYSHREAPRSSIPVQRVNSYTLSISVDRS